MNLTKNTSSCYTIFVDIGTGRIKSELSISHKRDFMVGSAVEMTMVHAENTKLCCLSDDIDVQIINSAEIDE